MFPPLRLREALSLGGLSVRELVLRTWEKVNENEIMSRAAAARSMRCWLWSPSWLWS